MKNYLYKLIALLTLSFPFLFAHKQPIHQHITREAFKLLCKSYPQLATSEMANYIGTSETTSGGEEVSWGAGKIVSGVWIEDEYDIVYHYGIEEYPNFNQWTPDEFIALFSNAREAFVSITHFWDADRGLNSTVDLHDVAHPLGIPTYWSFSCENAMQKMYKYLNGDFNNRRLFNRVRFYTSCPSQTLVGLDLRMSNLYNLYNNTARLQAVQYQDEWNFAWHPTSCPSLTPQKEYVYEQLGRMCHLLEDQSVPAHIHCNSHAGKSGMYSDYYEEHAAGFHMWTADELFSNGQTFINPYNNWSDPLYYLMYSMNQATDHYASGLTDGDDNYDANCPGLSQIISTLGLPVSTSQVNDANCRTMHDKIFPLAIRATAGLLYWFAIESGMLNKVTVKNDFNANTVQVALNGGTSLSYPSGIVLSTINGNALTVSAASPQNAGNYNRYFWKWEKTNKNGQLVSTYSGTTWNTTVNGDHTYNARFNRQFNINLTASQYIETGSGATYTINGSNVGATGSTTFIERVGTPLSIQAVAPNSSWIFLNWNDGNTNQSRSIIPTDHSSLFANYKGALASSTTAALANTGQRKVAFVTQDNCTHYVYESAGKIWHERVNSSGTTVSIRSFEGKNPSIAPINGMYSGTQVSYGAVIVYQAPPSYGNGVLCYAAYNPYTNSYYEDMLLYDAEYYSNLSSANLNPVVTSTYPEVCVVWQMPADPGYYPGGLFYIEEDNLLATTTALLAKLTGSRHITQARQSPAPMLHRQIRQ